MYARRVRVTDEGLHHCGHLGPVNAFAGSGRDDIGHLTFPIHPLLERRSRNDEHDRGLRGAKRGHAPAAGDHREFAYQLTGIDMPEEHLARSPMAQGGQATRTHIGDLMSFVTLVDEHLPAREREQSGRCAELLDLTVQELHVGRAKQ